MRTAGAAPGSNNSAAAARDTWEDLPAFMDWSAKAKKVVTLHSGTLVQGLW